MTWFTISLLAAVSFASVNFADKILLMKFVKNPAAAIKILTLFSGAIVLPFLFLQSQITIFWSLHMVFPIAAGILEIAYIYFYLTAIEKEPVAYMVPFFALSPIVVLLIERFFLSEKIHLFPIVGVIVIITGVVLLSIAKEGSFDIKNKRSILFMLLASLLYGLSGIFFKESGTAFSILETIIISRGGVCVGGIVLLWIIKDLHARNINKKSWWFVISELLYFLSVYLLILAIAHGSAGYVYGVVNIQPLFVFLGSYLLYRFLPKFFPEKFSFHRPGLAFLAVITIVAGSLLMLF